MADEFSKFRWNDHPLRVSLKGAAGALATEMYNRANPDGTEVYGSQENLAEKLTVSVRTVRRAQKELESKGLIRLEKAGSSYGQSSNRYVLTMPEADRTSSPDKTPPPAGLTETSPDTEEPHRTLPGSPANTGSPDMPKAHRTFVSSPDTSVRLIDPIPSTPKGVEVVTTRRTSEMFRPTGRQDTSGVRLDDGEDDPQEESEPAVPAAVSSSTVGGHSHVRLDPFDPFGDSVPASPQQFPPSDAFASSDPQNQSEGTPAMTDPSDPWATPYDPFAPANDDPWATPTESQAQPIEPEPLPVPEPRHGTKFVSREEFLKIEDPFAFPYSVYIDPDA